MDTVAAFSLLATVAALIGALCGVLLHRRASQTHITQLLLAAAGVLGAVIVCDVLPDSKAALSWPAFALAVGGGWAAFALFTRYVYPLCPSCAFGSFDEEKRTALRRTAALLLFALSLHSALDGVAVAVGGELSHHAGRDLLIALTLHKLPEGFALAVLLLAAGYAPHRTLAWAVLVESATLAGGLIGAWVLHGLPPQILGLLLASIGGGFLSLITGTIRQTVFDPAEPRAARLRSFLTASVAFVVTSGLLALLRTL